MKHCLLHTWKGRRNINNMFKVICWRHLRFLQYSLCDWPHRSFTHPATSTRQSHTIIEFDTPAIPCRNYISEMLLYLLPHRKFLFTMDLFLLKGQRSKLLREVARSIEWNHPTRKRAFNLPILNLYYVFVTLSLLVVCLKIENRMFPTCLYLELNI